jgi:xanthine/uracil permease
MKSWKESFKPRGSRRVQVLLAGAMWSLVGAGLLTAGTVWIAGDGLTGIDSVLLTASIVVGLVKSRFILDKSARKIVDRIAHRGEGGCLGGFLSPGSWGLVLMMIVLGRVLRHFLPPVVAGCLYTAVGTGLLLSSRLPWIAWRRMKDGPFPPSATPLN